MIDSPHIPVLRDEAVAALAPHAGGRYLDATFGAGGYTRAILATPETRVLTLDRDPSAIRGGYALVDEMRGADAREASRRLAVQGRAEGAMDREPPARISSSSPRLTLVEARFSALAEVARTHGFAPLDGVVFDIGVSSMQFDQAERGFSFRFDGPLDMRMEASGTSAADIVNEADEETLADILYFYGEERAARRIARAIVHDRRLAPFTSTKPLAEMIARVAPNRASDIHPATKSFQALRIAVNDELGQLLDGLVGAEAVLKEGGRLAVVTFHSLEDRIVKQFLAERCGRGETGSRRLPGEAAPPPASFICEGRQPVVPSREETQANPRARSAKLRYATRTAAPALPIGDKLSRLARPLSRDNKTTMGKA